MANVQQIMSWPAAIRAGAYHDDFPISYSYASYRKDLLQMRIWIVNISKDKELFGMECDTVHFREFKFLVCSDFNTN